MASKGKSDPYHREAPQPMDGDVAMIQMDFMFVGAEGTTVDEPRAKATVLMVISTKELRSRRMVSPALSRSLGEYKLDVTRQRLWHRRVLDDIKKFVQWNVRMEQCTRSCGRISERITWMYKSACK